MRMSTSFVERHEGQHFAGHVGIPVWVLRLLPFARVDLFAAPIAGQPPQVLHEAHRELGPEEIAQIEQRAAHEVFVRKRDLPTLSVSISKNWDAVLADTRLTTAERFTLLQLSLWEPLEHNSRRFTSDRFVEIAHEAGIQFAALLGPAPILASELYEHSLRDDSRPVHLTNVAGCMVLLACASGINEPAELAKIATGALLHEFGMLFIPSELLHKSGRLTVQERELLERVPSLGYEKLYVRDDLEFGQLMMVYQQHERFDGSGYPVGVEADEIHPWARMLTVVDYFDTMLAKKAYRRESHLAEVWQHLADNASFHFDSKVVQCWTTIFPHP